MSPCRFDVFVFDPADGRLEHAESGEATTLRPQVASLLARLLATPRTVVERDALCRAVWGDKAVVDFESGLAAVVRELRQSFARLGGSADLLETVPRRGYRLLADVSAVSARSGSAPLADDSPEPAPALTARPVGRRAGGLLLSLAALAALAAVAGLGWWLRAPPAPAPDGPDSAMLALAVLPFERYGADLPDGARLELLLADSLLAELWRAELEQVALLGRATLRPYQGRDDVAAMVARDLGANLLVEGSIVRDETGWRITARLLEMPGGRILWLDGAESGEEVLPTREIAAGLATSLALAWKSEVEHRALQGLAE